MIEWSTEQIIPLIIVGVIGVFVLLWSYLRRSPQTMNGGKRFTAFCLKICGLALLISYLLEPRQVKSKVSPGENSFVVLYDNSASMNLVDVPGADPRGESLREIVSQAYQSDGSGWKNQLEKWFQVRDYTLGDRLESADAVLNPDFSGSASPLLTSLEQIQSRFRNRYLAGVLLFSDGSATDSDLENSIPWGEFPPVYTVPLGKDPETGDISIQKTYVSQTVFENAPVNLKVDGKVYGNFNAPSIQVDLVDADGVVIDSKLISEFSPNNSWVARFSFEPDPALAPFYHVRAYREGLEDPSIIYNTEGTGPEDESTYWNNVALFAVNAPEGPFRILYVSGRPNWEFKFMNRSISEDPALRLSALIRVAKREPKFEFRGRGGSSANPLFQGLNDPAMEETRRYDEPVLTRINVLSEDELKDGFPKFKEDLYQYHALILDDVEAEFFTRDQLYLIRDFVSRRGGGFLMLGGQESFSKGGYAGTPVEDVLPFYLNLTGSRDPGARQGSTSWVFTEAGWQEAWSRTQETQDEEKAWLKFSPEWDSFNRVGRAKPGASLLAELVDEAGNRFPALAVQNYGAGKSAALTMARFWRTQFRTPVEDDGFEKRWRQMARWLTVDAPSRLQTDVVTDHDSGISGMQRVSSKVFSKEFEPEAGSQVSVMVTEYHFQNGRFKRDPERSNWRLPSYQGEVSHEKIARYLPRAAGGSVVETIAMDSNGIEIDRQQDSQTSSALTEELNQLEPNHELLKRLSNKTGGALIASSDLEKWAAELESIPAPKSISYSVPLWHGPWPLLAALFCFIAEWGIRRLNMAA